VRKEKPESRRQNPEGGGRTVVGRTRRLALLLSTGYWLLATGFFFATAGCADDSSSNDPTQKAMQDPMHYKPEFEPRNANEGRNQQDGLGKDLDHVLNP
jgi:hypothetical protein